MAMAIVLLIMLAMNANGAFLGQACLPYCSCHGLDSGHCKRFPPVGGAGAVVDFCFWFQEGFLFTFLLHMCPHMAWKVCLAW